MRFNGLTRCKLDSNGRIKLTPKAIDDLLADGNGLRDIVVYCLPEGGLGLYTQRTWKLMRSHMEEETPILMDDNALRHRSRKIEPYADDQEISPQGRLTIPPLFREKLGFKEGDDLLLAGVGHGYEIWTEEMWEKEMAET